MLHRFIQTATDVEDVDLSTLDVNEIDEENYTPLHMATMLKSPEWVHALLGVKADPRIPTVPMRMHMAGSRMYELGGNTALHLAILVGSLDIVKVLLQHDSGDQCVQLENDCGLLPVDLLPLSTASEVRLHHMWKMLDNHGSRMRLDDDVIRARVIQQHRFTDFLTQFLHLVQATQRPTRELMPSLYECYELLTHPFEPYLSDDHLAPDGQAQLVSAQLPTADKQSTDAPARPRLRMIQSLVASCPCASCDALRQSYTLSYLPPDLISMQQEPQREPDEHDEIASDADMPALVWPEGFRELESNDELDDSRFSDMPELVWPEGFQPS